MFNVVLGQGEGVMTLLGFAIADNSLSRLSLHIVQFIFVRRNITLGGYLDTHRKI